MSQELPNKLLLLDDITYKIDQSDVHHTFKLLLVKNDKQQHVLNDINTELDRKAEAHKINDIYYLLQLTEKQIRLSQSLRQKYQELNTELRLIKQKNSWHLKSLIQILKQILNENDDDNDDDQQQLDNSNQNQNNQAMMLIESNNSPDKDNQSQQQQQQKPKKKSKKFQSSQNKAQIYNHCVFNQYYSSSSSQSNSDQEESKSKSQRKLDKKKYKKQIEQKLRQKIERKVRLELQQEYETKQQQSKYQEELINQSFSMQQQNNSLQYSENKKDYRHHHKNEEGSEKKQQQYSYSKSAKVSVNKQYCKPYEGPGIQNSHSNDRAKEKSKSIKSKK